MAHLISPFIDNRHVDVINEDCHSAPTRRSIGAANSFFNITLNCSLQSQEEFGIKIRNTIIDSDIYL